MSKKKVYILCGISGSGKSTAATTVTRDLPAEEYAIVSADKHMVDRSGKWQFDPTRLSLCHSICQEELYTALYAEVPIILVDNTNLVQMHRQLYIDAALKFGYEVTILVFDIETEVALKRNIHGVPRHTLETQRRKLDIAPGIYHITYEPINKVA